jgi:4-methyl-5(b-hydroxyethyl)-thiazole monophosphate biosynthesis
MAKKVLVLLAEGFEEVEALTPIDYLRRAGIEVTAASVGVKASGNSFAVKGSHGITVLADASLEELSKDGALEPSIWDAVVVPGGLPGADNLHSSEETSLFLKSMTGAGKLLCAICAAPARVLFPLGLLNGKSCTCFPGEEKNATGNSSGGLGAQWKQERVVVDGSIITSRGAGTAGEFACAIIEKLKSKAEGDSLADRVLMLRTS